jgi:SAM-dependent methyltransferase
MLRRGMGHDGSELARTHALPDSDGAMHKGQIFRALLAPMRPGRLLDLGAGKGNFSLAAAALGWEATAVDARTVRFPDAETEPDPELAARIRAIRWVQADVREFPIADGEYDLICVLGLLHHLELSDQIDLLTRCAGTLLLLDTRIAPAVVDRAGTYDGIMIQEHGKTPEARDQIPTASWGNAISFRHTEESLVRLLRDCGYAQIMPMRPPHREDYTYYLCLPDPKGRSRRRQQKRSRATSIHRSVESVVWLMLGQLALEPGMVPFLV